MAKQCFICGIEKSLESHHIFPVQFGGLMDGPKIDLCATHHTEAHDTASKIWKHEMGLEAVANPRMAKLVEAVLKQQQEFQITGTAPDARRRIVAHLSPEQQQAVRLIKNHNGFTNQERALIWLIETEAAAIKAGKRPVPGAR